MRRGCLALIVLGAVVTGCAVGPDFHRPRAPSDRSYTSNAAGETQVTDERQRFEEGKTIAADWWRILRCPAVDWTIAQAFAGNPGLEAARATLRRNQDSLRAGYGVFFPQIDARAGATRQLYNPAPGAIPIPASTYNLFTLSGTVSYAIDVWGGARRQVEVLHAAVDAQRYALSGAYVVLTSNIIDALIAQAAYQAEVEATKQTLVVLRDQVRVANAQATGGTAPYANVLSLQSQVATTEASLPPLEQKVDQASDLLAVLTGRTPASWELPPPALSDFQLPADLPITLPSQLVEQRPDILVAEAELHAANASIGVATAAMLPNITLSASYGFNSTTPADLFASGSSFWNLAAGLTQPLFHGGALYYQRKAAVDARDAAAAQYRQVVLTAFEQVADTLRGLSHDANTVEAQTKAVQTSEKALRLIQANYQAGIATYLQVLVADIQYLQAETSYIQAIAQRLQDTVALYVALGGGWWNDRAVLHG